MYAATLRALQLRSLRRTVAAASPLVSSSSAVTATPLPSSLRTQQRFLEYWGMGVTGRTQPYAQGDMLPRLDNTKLVVNKSSAAGAALTGNQNNMTYDSENIFSVTGYSAAERDHYQPLRGITTHRIDKVDEKTATAVSDLLVKLLSTPDGSNNGLTLRAVWWSQLLKDFPSLRKPCTAEFRTAWEVFFASATAVAHDKAGVEALGRPFLIEQLEKNFICYAMFWRITERLCDGLDLVPGVTAHERRMGRIVLEHVTKIALDTVAAEPWAHPETTSPLHVDVSQFRAWHEAGNW